MSKKQKKLDAVRDHWAGRTDKAKDAGLRAANCGKKDCAAEDYYMAGDSRDEGRAEHRGT